MATHPPLLELFAGYGGLGLAVEAALGARTTALAEFDDAPSRVLAARFPHAPNMRDVTTARWSDAGHVAVISGGSPCQDISGAGRRAGMINGNRSGLWVSMRDAIADRRPEYVVWENVRAATTAKASTLTDPDGKAGHLRALGRVLGDLASLGYDAEWVLVRASDVGACHQRARVFLLAWDRYAVPALPINATPYAEWSTSGDSFLRYGEIGVGSIYADKMRPNGAMRAGHLYERPTPTAPPALKLLPTPRATDGPNGGPGQTNGRGGVDSLPGLFGAVIPEAGPIKLLPTPRTTDANGAGRHGDGGADLRTIVAENLIDLAPLKLLPTPVAGLHNDGESVESFHARRAKLKARGINGNGAGEPLTIVAKRLGVDGWGEYLPAIVRHAYTLGMHDVPAPTEPGAKQGARPRLAAPFVEWMMGLPAGWVTDPELELTRTQQLKALGNGVVPQQAEAALRYMLATGLGRTDPTPRVD